jgi:hypothetical protein
LARISSATVCRYELIDSRTKIFSAILGGDVYFPFYLDKSTKEGNDEEPYGWYHFFL